MWWTIFNDGPNFNPICLINVSVLSRSNALPSISSWKNLVAKFSNVGSIFRIKSATSLGVKRSGRRFPTPLDELIVVVVDGFTSIDVNATFVSCADRSLEFDRGTLLLGRNDRFSVWERNSVLFRFVFSLIVVRCNGDKSFLSGEIEESRNDDEESLLWFVGKGCVEMKRSCPARIPVWTVRTTSQKSSEVFICGT